MNGVILANGLGTRMRPLTNDIPKSLVPVAGKPLIERIIDHMRDNQVRQIVVTCGVKGQQIQDYLGDGERLGVWLHYAASPDDPLQLPNTAGEIAKAAPYLTPDEPFLVVYGDTLSGTNYLQMREFHERRKATITMAGLWGIPVGTSHLSTDDLGKIVSWEEKPTLPLLANIPEFICEPRLLEDELVGYGRDFSSEVIPKYVALGQAYCHVQPGNYHCDIGTLERLEQTEALLAAGRIPPGTVLK
ncbi:hypothetical protein COY28_00815 [Candidatus Woesearchaeota archaeon CG_4_10_14_0_2_um_filter_57_5]|nr:MAG: hypothetical protein AUJ68_07065 [Candidatus Woesearchaeota archaeon CG1_02_57_44]PIN68909.1 MAG: hypothetical protein COV94_03615 [Candidatus Woesearchaeota archaeon CG11_big_fil_rev_8_21_14_0_20_57_5]PIZ56664.1 MAG: hypothetical protein COY28_00815 [Candidatus Woesearchaeota archaeon CG_4_10_14_0_2_um_filter_57_5]